MVAVCINHIVGITRICVVALSFGQFRSVVITNVLLPTLRLHSQSTEVQLQLITVRIRSTDETSLVGSIICSGCHISIITATHQLVIYDDILRKIESCLLSVNLHATHIATTVNRTEVGGVWDICGRITTRLFGKHNAGDKRHGDTFHVGGECFGIIQVDRAEWTGVACILIWIYFFELLLHCAQHAFVMTTNSLIGSNHVLAIVAEEKIIDNSIRAYLQLHLRVFHV